MKKIDYDLFTIVEDGALSSTSIGEGRLVPGLVVNSENNIQLKELIEYHQSTPPGDINLHWAKSPSPFKKNILMLTIEFVQPIAYTFGLDFRLDKNYPLIDGIMQSRAMYLQVGEIGDKFSQFKNPSILVEVPEMQFDQIWNKTLLNVVKKKLRKSGLSRKEASRFASQEIKSAREIWGVRR